MCLLHVTTSSTWVMFLRLMCRPPPPPLTTRPKTHHFQPPPPPGPPSVLCTCWGDGGGGVGRREHERGGSGYTHYYPVFTSIFVVIVFIHEPDIKVKLHMLSSTYFFLLYPHQNTSKLYRYPTDILFFLF